MQRDLTLMKDSLTSCDLATPDAPDAFRGMLSDLSDFLQQIGDMLDNRGLEAPGRKIERPATSSDHPGGAAG